MNFKKHVNSKQNSSPSLPVHCKAIDSWADEVEEEENRNKRKQLNQTNTNKKSWKEKTKALNFLVARSKAKKPPTQQHEQPMDSNKDSCGQDNLPVVEIRATPGLQRNGKGDKVIKEIYQHKDDKAVTTSNQSQEDPSILVELAALLERTTLSEPNSETSSRCKLSESSGSLRSSASFDSADTGDEDIDTSKSGKKNNKNEEGKKIFVGSVSFENSNGDITNEGRTLMESRIQLLIQIFKHFGEIKRIQGHWKSR